MCRVSATSHPISTSLHSCLLTFIAQPSTSLLMPLPKCDSSAFLDEAAAYEAPSNNLIKDLADEHKANKFEDDAPTMELFGGDNVDTCNCAMSSDPKRCKKVVANFHLCVAKHTRSNILQGRDRWVGCEDERATMDRMCTGETAGIGNRNRNRSCLCVMSSNPQRCNRVVHRFDNCVRKRAKNNVLSGRPPFAGCENRRAAMERMQNALCPAETETTFLIQAAASCALRGFSLGATLVAFAAILIIH